MWLRVEATENGGLRDGAGLYGLRLHDLRHTVITELAEMGGRALDFAAESDTELMIGSAIPHPHDLALGSYSVHTSPASLRAGEQRLQEIQRRLRSEGRL